METFTINKLGAIFFKRIPDKATVFIEKNELNFESGLLTSSLFIANLFPKTYEIKITKDGYQSWQKTLSVKPSLVTEVPPIILLPFSIDLGKPLLKQREDFWVGPKYLISRSPNRVLWFNNQKIVGEEIASWSEDGETVISRSGNTYFATNLQMPWSAINLNLALANLKIKSVQFHPQNSDELIIQTTAGLYLLNIQSLVLKIFKSTIADFQPITRLESSPNKNYLALLNEKNELYLIDFSNSQPKKLADNATDFKFSPDEKQIAFITKNKEVVTDFLKENKAMAVLNIGIPEDGKLSWHRDSSHLFIQYPEALYLLEGNNLPPINLQLVTNGATQHFYKAEENILYILKNQSLYKLNFE